LEALKIFGKVKVFKESEEKPQPRDWSAGAKL
jgi:hypothetical protein